MVTKFRMGFLYFAYGSNLLQERIRINNPSAVYKGVVKLQGYKFLFGWPVYLKMKSINARWKGCAATILEDKNYAVWGTLWEVDDSERANLDKQESIYNPIHVTVTDKDGNSSTCLTYQMKGELDVNDTLPSPHYKDVVLRGARQSELPEDYIQFIESLPDNGYEGQVDLYEKLMDLLDDAMPSDIVF